MLADIKIHIEELERVGGNYWSRFPTLEVPSYSSRRSEFSPGRYNQAKSVICNDTGEIYPSASAAAASIGTSQGNVSAVCTGQREHAKGTHFAYVADYDAGTRPQFKSRRGGPKAVICIDADEGLDSITAAADAKGLDGSKITMVCKGIRKSTGGRRWRYVDSD